MTHYRSIAPLMISEISPALGTSVLSDGLGRDVGSWRRRWPKGMRQTIALQTGQRKCRNGRRRDKASRRNGASSNAGRTGGVAGNGLMPTAADNQPDDVLRGQTN